MYIIYVEISEANEDGSVKEGEVNLNYVNISEASEDGSVKEGEVSRKGMCKRRGCVKEGDV